MKATMTDDINTLADHIAARLAARLPVVEGLWGGDQVAAYLGVSARQAKERICLLPDFPRPIRLPGGGRGAVAKRWHPAEVMEWAERHRDKRRAA